MKKFLSFALMLCMLVSVVAPTLVFAADNSELPEGAEMFWVTHYNDGAVEGSGVIFTEADTAGGWWLHVAFAPVEEGYQIVEISNGLSNGSGAKVAVPEGGFVWAANYGNNYPAIYGNPDDIDYTSPNCSDAIGRAAQWQVGDIFAIGGVDFESIPTSTPDVAWYDDAYVCDAYIVKVGHEDVAPEPEPEPDPELPEGALEFNLSHVNLYSWGTYYDFVTYGEGRNCHNLGNGDYGCDWWIAIKVDNVDGVYTVTEIEGNGTAKAMAASADGFVMYLFSGNATCPENFAAAQQVQVGYTVYSHTFDWTTDAASETALGNIILVPGAEAPVEPEDPEEPEVPDANGNLALGKEYTAVGLHPNGAEANYPDEGGVTLTDGISAGESFWDAVWVGFNKQSPEYDASEGGKGAYVVLDLGEAQDLSKIVFTAFKDGSAGITVPYWVNVSVSDDGENFTYAGYIEINPDNAPSGTNVFEGAISGKGRYVQVCFYLYGWGFISEIELYGAEETPDVPDVPVEPEDPETESIVIDGKLDDSGYTNAVWFDKGVWQTIGEGKPILEGIDIKYTTRTDADNVYLTIQVTDEVVLARALDPNAWDQSGATNYRIWFKGDGMETRTFYDLLWDGEKLVPHRQKVATDEITFAFNTDDGVLTLEMMIAKASLSITDSYELMVTYSAPDFGEGENVGYNAFHMTEFVRGEDGALPSGWSGNTSMYVLYNDADVRLGAEETPDVPVEPETNDVVIHVGDNALLTDGKSGYTGNWGEVGTGDVLLIQNGECQNMAMHVEVIYDLGKATTINSLALDFYHCAGVMIGYPEGQILVEVSADGENYDVIGYYDIASADVVIGGYGTVTTLCEFDAVEATYVKASFLVGSSTGVLGDTPSDGKVFWEFASLAEVAVGIVEAPVVELPEGAIILDYAGYVHDSYYEVLAGDNLTVAELTALGIGASKDMNYFVVAVVGADGVITEMHTTLGRPDGVKSDVVCPAGGYIIGLNANKAGYDALLSAKVGDSIELYNVDVDSFRGKEGSIALENAGFVIVPAPVVEPEDPEVPEAGTNLALGKGWYGDTEIGTGYVGNLTDGVIDPDGQYDTNLWYGADNRKGDSFTMIVDLGALYDIDEVRIHTWPAGYSGIMIPGSYDFYASVDGENFDLLGSVTSYDGTSPQWVGVALDEAINVQYVKITMTNGTSGVFWFASEIEVLAAGEKEPEIPDEPEIPEEEKTYENTLAVGDDGNASVEVPYGYTWNVDYINGSLAGEDVTICTTLEAYQVSNPKWAISVILEKQADGTYVAVSDAITGSGTVPEISLGENQIVLVVHSSSSRPSDADLYPNWIGKIVARSVKAGQIFFVDMDAMTVYAARPGETYEPPVACGDVDGDGVINGLDATRLLNYLANYDYENGGSTVEVTKGADCNGDGVIDGRDSIRLLRYLANYDPATGESSVTLG